MIVLGAVYAWQHQHQLLRWWQSSTNNNVGAVSTSHIVVYSAEGCSPCDAAVMLLRSAGQRVERRHIDSDEAAREAFEQADGQALPMIVDGSRVMQGFNPELLKSWYSERAQNKWRLEQLGIYKAGERREPILYGTTWCPYCAAARQYFAQHGIAFRDLDIEHDAEAKRQHASLGFSGVPVIIYADMVSSGFSAQAMDMKRQWVGDGSR
jgi:glutaredoxin